MQHGLQLGSTINVGGEMAIKIEKIENGYLVTDEAEHPEDTTRRYCVTEEDDFSAYSGGEAKTMYDLLWLVKELTGITEGRYDKQRVYVEMKHGDKHECFDENCEICANEFEEARYSLSWEKERATEIEKRRTKEIEEAKPWEEVKKELNLDEDI